MNTLNDGGLNNQVTKPPINSEQATTLIVELAKQLVNRVIEIRGNNKPPFLPVEYARLKGIKNIIKADLGKTSGLLLRFHDGPVIKINQNQSLTRQNFSCAHEIGHILFSELKLENYISGIEHRTFNPQAKMKVRADARERLCDAAATELLMPEAIYQKYLSSFGVTIHAVERLSDIFQVSLRAAVRRIAEVSIEPCIALVWQPLQKTNMLQLVQCTGPERKPIYSPVHTKIRYPSVLHKALEQNRQEKCYKSFKIGTGIKRLPMESKGFGRDEYRCVVSLAFLDR